MSIRRPDMQLIARIHTVLGRLRKPRRLLAALANEKGSVLVVTVLLMPVVLGFLGLMLDGSLLYAARRELQDAADSAALAGAMQADLEYFAQTGFWRIADSTSMPGVVTADQAVQEVCNAYAVSCTTEVSAEHGQRLLRVTAQGPFATVFLHLLLGQQEFTIEATSAAIMVPGY